MSNEPAKNLQKQDRTSKGTFARGVSGNPRGRERGSLNKATIAAMDLLSGDAENLTRRAIELAMDGDIAALKLCLERLVPVQKERVLPAFELPRISSASDLPRLTSAVLEALASGQITPSEGERITGIVAQYSKILELSELADRVAALEKRARS